MIRDNGSFRATFEPIYPKDSAHHQNRNEFIRVVKSDNSSDAINTILAFRMMPQRMFWFRKIILVYACILAVQAAWLMAAEFIRPKLSYFPQDKGSEQRASAARSAAVTAASIGWARGDLWTDAALEISSGVIGEVVGESDSEMTSIRRRANAVARRAAGLSPHDSRIWLLLAALESRFDWPSETANRLKMSYFTGPNELALIPLRIRIATRSMAITDAELQTLVAQEIRTVILRHQDQKPFLLAAYRDGSAEGKQFIEATVRDLDKNLLAAIRASSNRQ
jgi:hypothetical protein